MPIPTPIERLHHVAYRAKDAEQTRHFYEDILGLPLYHIIENDYTPMVLSSNSQKAPVVRSRR